MNMELFLEKSQFMERYKALYLKYSNRENLLEKYDPKIVKTLIENMGYKVRFYKSETFFRVHVLKEPFKVYYNLSLKYGLVETILAIYDRNGEYQGGGPVAWLKRNEEGGAYTRDPGFKNYDELEDILRCIFKMIEDNVDIIEQCFE